MTRVELRKGYVLHQRSLSDSRRIVDIFTLEFGRVSGALRVGKKTPALLQFQPYLFSWLGHHEFKTFTCHEADGCPVPLAGDALYYGFYLNELLQRLLPSQEEDRELFYCYEHLLKQLHDINLVEPQLRHFELLLLRSLGYEYSFEYEGFSQEPLRADRFYNFNVRQGFVAKADGLFCGADVLACNAGLVTAATLYVLKRVCRMALAARLGREPLKSREFFSKP